MNKRKQVSRRELRVRSKVQGTKDRPRLSIFRSNRFVYAQLINDEEGKTIVGISEHHMTTTEGSPTERAKAFGLLLAKRAREKKVNSVVFDRGRYAYHGIVRAVADGAREGGLTF